VFKHVEKVIYAAQRTKGEEEFEYQLLADALALILQSPDTPADLRNTVERASADLAVETNAQDTTDPDNLREWFPVALDRLKQKGASKDEAQG
jgi:hypothetical protein